MITQEEIKDFINSNIRPLIQADGGEIKLVSFTDNTVIISAEGECSRCPVTNTCYKEWLTSILSSYLNKIINVKIIMNKPYFWNK